MIQAEKGSNNLVESCRGLKVNLSELPTVPELNSDDKETVRDMIKEVEEEDDKARNGTNK